MKSAEEVAKEMVPDAEECIGSPGWYDIAARLSPGELVCVGESDHVQDAYLFTASLRLLIVDVVANARAEGAAAERERNVDAFNAGRDAARRGEPMDANPHAVARTVGEMTQSAWWKNGWSAGAMSRALEEAYLAGKADGAREERARRDVNVRGSTMRSCPDAQRCTAEGGDDIECGEPAALIALWRTPLGWKGGHRCVEHANAIDRYAIGAAPDVVYRTSDARLAFRWARGEETPPLDAIYADQFTQPAPTSPGSSTE